MKLPMHWMRDFAPAECTAQEFADKMTMSGSKVETFEREADAMHNVVVGQVAALERMAESDHLWVCQVDVGKETLQIVTGAQNLQAGDLCPVALHGAKLPNGMEIKKGKLRGVESNGMLCSLPELGLTTHDFPDATEDGILVLHDEFALGSPAEAALGMDDTVFEFEITPNRPDCLSVRGLAREAAATFGVLYREHTPPMPKGSGDINGLMRVKVEATDTCNRYACAVVDNVRIAPSPRWMRERLRHAGVRPINNIVDITNYVMLEYGQPMHAFDYTYVNGSAITVRKARAGEQIVTLDGIARKLDEQMMVIADEQSPIAVAGVMGGEFSGVYDTTQRVVFESASFNGPSVRATSRRLALRTESSSRFEKGLDPETVEPALYRALELVQSLDAGDVVEGILDDYPAPEEKRFVPFNPGKINALLGVELPAEDMVEILLPLGFGVEDETVSVPSWRTDVERDCDIAEEVARFAGYNKLPSTILGGEAKAKPTERQVFERQAVERLVGYGLWECFTFSFYSPKSFDQINLPAADPLRHPVVIANPLGEDTSVMRSTALPSILEVAARNWAARNEEAALFELATVYRPLAGEGLPEEKQVLVLAAYGEHWDYLAMKGVLEALFSSFGLPETAARRVEDAPSYHPGRCADLVLPVAQGETVLARLGEVHPAVLTNYGIKAQAVAAEIDFDTLFQGRGPMPQYKHLPKFPAITRDLALVCAADTPAAEVAGAIRKAAGKRLENLSLFDVYTGEKVGAGHKSLAYNLVLRDGEKTLTDTEADTIVGKVLAALEAMNVRLRA